MNEQEINSQFVIIRRLIGQKRLNEALTQMEALLIITPNSELASRFETVRTSYGFMLDYMRQGMNDPQREDLHTRLLTQALEIADRLRLLLLDRTSAYRYHLIRMARKDIKSTAENWQISRLENIQENLLSEVTQGESRRTLIRQQDDILNELFFDVWTVDYWDRDKQEAARNLLQSNLLNEFTKSIFVAAVTLSLMECFDYNKLMWLMDAYLTPWPNVNQRALVGIAFTLHLYDKRITRFYPEIIARMKLLNDETDLSNDMIRLYRNVLLCQETEKIDKKMRDEIIPEMMKSIPYRMRFGTEETDENKDDRNPDWESFLEKSGVNKKLIEMNELQMEGADVYMSTFAPMKTHPFFSSIPHWLFPFDEQQADVSDEQNEGEKKNSFINLLTSTAFFCNNDKYSLFFMLKRLSSEQQSMMFSQLSEQQMQTLQDEMNGGEMKKLSEKPATVASQYLHDLYRVFRLSPLRSELHDIFRDKIEWHTLATLKDVLCNEKCLAVLFDFFMRKEHWNDVIEMSRIIVQKGFGLGQRAEFYQETGYAFQKEKRYNEAIDAYRKADAIKSDSLWTNRHLATCYRLSGSLEEALAAYRQVEKVEPENKTVLYYISCCLAELKQYNEATNSFFKLDFMENDSLRAWRGIAWCSFASDKMEQADKYYKKLIDSKQAITSDYMNAGHTAWSVGNFKEALLYYGEASRKSKNKETFIEQFFHDKDYLLLHGISEDSISLLMELL